MSPEAPLERIRAFKAKLDRYRFLEEREAYEESLTAFMQGAWHSVDSAQYQSCWAIDAICDHLEAVTLGHIPRLLINVPPRCSKTTAASICWPAWTWARSARSYWSGPQVKFLCGSYNNSLALINSNKTRRLITSPWYQKYWGERFSLMEDQNTKTQFDNTEGGSRLSTSVGGSLLGIGGDVLCIDDPHNTETEKVIETDADRKKVASWWREVSSTRLNDPKRSSIVVVMQRLHRQDLSGLILDAQQDGADSWVHLMIPMRHDVARHSVTVKLPQYGDDLPWEDPRTEEGELMWPERFGELEVHRQEINMGPYMASGRLQQSPVPKGGGILDEQWWRLWGADEAHRYGLEWSGGLKEFPHFDLVVGSLDTSYGEKQENDYNALTVWGLWTDLNKNRRAMLVYAWNKRLPLHGQFLTRGVEETQVNFQQRQQQAFGLIEWVAETCKRYKVQRLLIENKTRGRDVANEIKRLYASYNWGVELIQPVGDKVARTHSVVPLFTDGAIYAPNTAWAEAVIQQCSNFPKDVHDDMHDTVTQFLNWARENGLLVRGDEMGALLEDEMAYRPPTRSVASQYGV